MKPRDLLPGPVPRLAVGVISLLLFLLMMLEVLVGLTPDRHQDAVRIRTRIAESLAAQVASLVQNGTPQAASTVLRDVLLRDKELLSVALRRLDGRLIVIAGPHEANWSLPQDVPATLANVRVPLLENGQPWGDVEMSFAPIRPESLSGWLQEPTVRALLLFSILGVGVVYLYLRRALQYLDPSMAVPQRVRAAFDTLREGVLLLDAEHRIVLANRAFARVHPEAGHAAVGKSIEALQWLTAHLDRDGARWPWQAVAREREPIDEQLLELPQPLAAEPVRLLLNASPILDGDGRYRGCMISMSDVSALHRSNEELRQTIQALDESNEKIRQQNDELKRLATCDPLTGCLNRRAFYERLAIVLSGVKRTGQPVGCIMTDIDHFKRFNDTYGHAIGDQVLRAVSTELGRGIRDSDLLCRFGGEEFCIVLPGLGLEESAAVAERLRAAIEEVAGAGVQTAARVKVTSSFGVSQLSLDRIDEADMINRADAALYVAKGSGRNRVATELEVTGGTLAK